MKYGSTLRIQLKDIWSEEVIKEYTVTYADTTVSKSALDDILKQIRSWYVSSVLRSQRYQHLSDEDLIGLAQERGLDVSRPISNLSKLYYVPSRSGKTPGHYIEVDENYNHRCSCPGFVNRASCWAINNYKIGDTWAASRDEFFDLRRAAYTAADWGL